VLPKYRQSLSSRIFFLELKIKECCGAYTRKHTSSCVWTEGIRILCLASSAFIPLLIEVKKQIANCLSREQPPFSRSDQSRFRGRPDCNRNIYSMADTKAETQRAEVADGNYAPGVEDSNYASPRRSFLGGLGAHYKKWWWAHLIALVIVVLVIALPL
jgi:uncharacterized membrane protein YdfJ with MMPL/SSD domain